MNRRHVEAGRDWGRLVGYHRAVRVGPLIEVAGTSATLPNGDVFAPGDPAAQAEHILDEIEGALVQLGASLADVVRTRVYLCDITAWPEVGVVHARRFTQALPTSTFLEVARLMSPELVVEIEATAYVESA